MDVLKLYVRHVAGQLHVGEIPKAADPKADQPVGRALGNGVGDRQHRHVRLVGGDEPLQLRHIQNGRTRHLGADEAGRDVKSGLQIKPRVVEPEILQ